MRIAVFIKKTTFHQGYRGLETQNRQLCEGLAKQGLDITVFSPQWEIKEEERYENGVKYIFVPCEYRMLFSSKKNNWINKSVLYFERYHNELPFDIVLGQSSSAIGIIKNKSDLNVKVISVAHGTIISELKTRINNLDSFKALIGVVPDTAYSLVNYFTRQREFIHGSDKIIAVSKYVKNSLIEETYADPKKFAVIFNGIDETKLENGIYKENSIQPAGSKVNEVSELDKPLQDNVTDVFRLLYVGQVIKEKGVFYLLKMFDDPRFNNIHLDIAGSGESLKTLKRIANSKMLSKQITFHGKLEYSKLLDLYTSTETKLFLFPTRRYEGFPMVIVEALMCGLPVVAFNMGGTFDAIVDGYNGYLIPKDDLLEFKSKILELINDPKKRKDLGLNAYNFAHENLTADKMIDEYIKVFKEVLDENTKNNI